MKTRIQTLRKQQKMTQNELARAVGVTRRTSISLKNEEELKALYVKEHDERVLLISQKASSLTVIMMLIGLGIATVISVFFNSTIFLTLVVVTFIFACVMIGTKRYYHKKF